MSKKVILITAGVIVAAILVYLNLNADTSNASEVMAAEVENHDLKEIVSASGRIQPKTKVDITSEVNGEIINLLVREGQPVSAGDLLVVLESTTYPGTTEEIIVPRLSGDNGLVVGEDVFIAFSPDFIR